MGYGMDYVWQAGYLHQCGYRANNSGEYYVVYTVRTTLALNWLPFEILGGKDGLVMPRSLRSSRPRSAGNHDKCGLAFGLRHMCSLQLVLARHGTADWSFFVDLLWQFVRLPFGLDWTRNAPHVFRQSMQLTDEDYEMLPGSFEDVRAIWMKQWCSDLEVSGRFNCD